MSIILLWTFKFEIIKIIENFENSKVGFDQNAACNFQTLIRILSRNLLIKNSPIRNV